jgi:S-adenosylmethionine/arginine decarboxylase-like enzyme
MLQHQHIVIRAYVNKPPMATDVIESWLKDLIQAIDMKILSGPHAVYLDKAGNRGLTAVTIIETSHIAIHVWDEAVPGLIQLDVYSCKEFDKETVFAKFAQFEPVSVEWFMMDRTDKLSITNAIEKI